MTVAVRSRGNELSAQLELPRHGANIVFWIHIHSVVWFPDIITEMSTTDGPDVTDIPPLCAAATSATGQVEVRPRCVLLTCDWLS
jgi:hypothetical protein